MDKSAQCIAFYFRNSLQYLNIVCYYVKDPKLGSWNNKYLLSFIPMYQGDK